MINFFKIIFLFSLSLNIFAQSGTATIIAVGDAEQEKETLYFSSIVFGEKDSEKLKKDINTFRAILINDFKFYTHRFEVSEKDVNESDFKIQFTVKNSLTISLANKDETLFEEVVSLNDLSKDLRSSAHKTSNLIYEKITSKESIFEKKIIFISDKGSTQKNMIKELYIMDFDGERKRRLTHFNSIVISPSISHDNRYILFSLIEEREQPGTKGKIAKVKNINLYMLDLETNKTSVVSNKVGINSGAIFDHTNENIYLTLTYGGNADVYILNIATQRLKKVTSHYSDDVDPSINHDGSMMTFLSGRSGRAMIYIMDPSGVEKDVKRISFVGRYNAAPRFSHDGKEIVFSSWVDRGFDLYKIGSDGNNLVRLTKNFGSNEEANFSPDGEFIIFTSQKVLSQKSALQNVYIMNTEGEIIKDLTNNFGKVFSPRWTN